MKRVLILIIAALFLLSGCVPASEEKPTEAPEASASPEPTEAPAPYKGGGSAYSFIWDNERDRAWEEDIVYFADRYTDPYNGHPLLSDRVVTVRDFNDPVLRYSSEHSDVFYDASLKEAFIAKINALLLDVPQLTDYEIEMRLEETAALLHDGHSFSNIPDCDIFPMWLQIVYSGEEMAVVVDYAPEENSDILGRRLTAINGKDVFEIAEMLRPFVSYEADTWFYSQVFSRRMILYSEVLRYIGVIGEESSAVFTVTDAAGNSADVTLSAVPVDKLWDGVVHYNVNESVYYTYTGYGVLSYNSSDDIWYAPMYDGSSLYIRLNTCYVDESIGETVENAFAEAREANCLEKVLVDFRFNSGGWLDLQGNFLPLAKALSESGAEVYVLIDGGSFSAAVGIPAVLKRRVDNLTIIGSPAGQAASFFFNGTFELPNSGLYCQYSKQRADFWPGSDDETLMPDITVYQSYIDYRLGVDSVLMYIFGK